MAQSPPLQSLDHWILPQGWGWAGHSDSTSPASSSDSSGSCPCDSARGSSQPAPPARGASTSETGPTAPGRARPGPAGGQRQSASEREKLRMRTLARALHELRRFLPPSVAPAGQSLTKIETLRLAIRYIGHLSAVLGLSEESLRRRQRRRGDATLPRGCPLCPDGGPAQAQTQTQARAPGLGSATPCAAPWGSPPACPGALAAPEPCDPPVLYDKAAFPEGQATEPGPSSPVSTSLCRRRVWGALTVSARPPRCPGGDGRERTRTPESGALERGQPRRSLFPHSSFPATCWPCWRPGRLSRPRTGHRPEQ